MESIWIIWIGWVIAMVLSRGIIEISWKLHKRKVYETKRVFIREHNSSNFYYFFMFVGAGLFIITLIKLLGEL